VDVNFCRWDLFQYKGKLAEEMTESAFNKGIGHGLVGSFATLMRPKQPSFSVAYHHNTSVAIKHNPSWLNPMCAFPDPAKEIIEKTIGSMMIPVRYLNNTKLSRV
jgi:hypothetical protein